MADEGRRRTVLAGGAALLVLGLLGTACPGTDDVDGAGAGIEEPAASEDEPDAGLDPPGVPSESQPGGGGEAVPETDPGGTVRGGAGDRDAFEPLDGVPGVSDEAITFALAGHDETLAGDCLLACFRDGVEAYFAHRNAEGGIYGRDLRLGPRVAPGGTAAATPDDQDGAFAVLGASDRVGAWRAVGGEVPAFAWQPVAAAAGAGAFARAGAPCADCVAGAIRHVARLVGATRVAVLGDGRGDPACTTAAVAAVEDAGGGLGLVHHDGAVHAGRVAEAAAAVAGSGAELVASCAAGAVRRALPDALAAAGAAELPVLHLSPGSRDALAADPARYQGHLAATAVLVPEAAAGGLLDDLLDALAATGGRPSELAVAGWVAADHAFQALLDAGPRFDRRAVLDVTRQMAPHTGGGLAVAYVPDADGRPAACTVLVRAAGDRLDLVGSPARPWLCWPPGGTAAEPEPTALR